MSREIIGSGFGRTGTRSLKEALEMLGFGPCHHMTEVFQNPAQVDHWTALAEGREVDWETVFAGYVAQVDWPGAHVWRELTVAFPDAKVLHSHRPPEIWWGSFSKTIGRLMQDREGLEISPHGAEMLRAFGELIMAETFDTNTPDEAAATAAYEQRLADVRAAVPADRLLVYDVSDGWRPLCSFLGVPVPAEPFPFLNRRSEFWQGFGGEPA